MLVGILDKHGGTHWRVSPEDLAVVPKAGSEFSSLLQRRSRLASDVEESTKT